MNKIVSDGGIYLRRQNNTRPAGIAPSSFYWNYICIRSNASQWW